MMFDFLESIDRNAIIVKPKRPYFDWLNSAMPEEEPVFENDENNIYLVPEMENNDKVKAWVKKNFETIFINELNDWCTDEDLWPVPRTYKLFTEWFDVEVCSMVLDLVDQPVTKD